LSIGSGDEIEGSYLTLVCFSLFAVNFFVDI